MFGIAVFLIFVLFNQVLWSHACISVKFILLLSSIMMVNLFPNKCNVLFFILFESSLWPQVNTRGPDNGLIWFQLFNFREQYYRLIHKKSNQNSSNFITVMVRFFMNKFYLGIYTWKSMVFWRFYFMEYLPYFNNYLHTTKKYFFILIESSFWPQSEYSRWS